MRKLAISVLLAGIGALALAEKPIATQTVTVAQLQQFLSAAGGVEDFALAKQIYDLRLTERLSDAKLVVLEKALPGPNSQLALTAIADESAVLSLPAAEIPDLPPPDPAAQSALLAEVNQYVMSTIKKLPDFYATRATYHLKGTVDRLPHDLRDQFYPDLGSYRDQRLYPMDRTSVTVYNRNEHEVLTKGKQEIPIEKTTGATFVGEFGPILAWAQACMHEGKVEWKHREFGEGEPLAIFHFSCSGVSIGGWASGSGGPGPVWSTGVLVDGLLENGPPQVGDVLHPLDLVAVDGEIGVVPANGSIRRLAFSENGRFPDPSLKAGLVEQWNYSVDYGPVEIGGMIYICPVRSVDTAKLPDPDFTKPRDQEKLNRKYGLLQPPQKEFLSDSIFDQYHLFRADVKILPGFETKPNAGPPHPPPAGSPPGPAAPPQK